MKQFKVVINTMEESDKGTSYIVTLIHPDRPVDALPWDDGKMEVFSTYIEEHAKLTKKDWEEFLTYQPRTFGM